MELVGKVDVRLRDRTGPGHGYKDNRIISIITVEGNRPVGRTLGRGFKDHRHLPRRTGRQCVR